ncbi:MAG: PspC domain-containing protein [Novosphingobium sp.]|nr:PspC domain-containing protein [Novosphingobium sp.]
MSARKFTLDKPNARLMGVCSGIAAYTGIDALWVRVLTILAVLAGFGLAIPVYIAIGLLADSGGGYPVAPYASTRSDGL